MPSAPSEPSDLWQWAAEYADGTVVFECDATGAAVHGLADVDLDRVVRFTLIPQRSGLPQATIALDPGRGERLIFARRRRITVDPQTGEEAAARRTVHLLGWQRRTHEVVESGEGSATERPTERPTEWATQKHLTYWFEDGSCLVSSDDQAV